MLLADHEIKYYCLNQGMIRPFEENLLFNQSLVVRVGSLGKAFTNSGSMEINLTEYSPEEPYYLKSGECLLVTTWEKINLPRYVCADFSVLEKRAKEFYNCISSGTFWDGGTRGNLVLAIKNSFPSSLPFYPGLQIGRLKFSETHLPDPN